MARRDQLLGRPERRIRTADNRGTPVHGPLESCVGRLTMSQNLERFKKLLAEVFQIDQAELDFGIYGVMNAKREENLG